MSKPVLTQPLDALRMPLLGLQLIEASAGTGKTWTLAALYLRLVLGHSGAQADLRAGLFPPQILVMTFTEAATAELRSRVRERLAQAARFFAQDSAQGDGFLAELRAAFDPLQWPECAARLATAAQWMDEAAIFTIHGWSHRMLRQHAFDSASLFEQARVEDGDHLRLLAAQDYWRRWCYPLSLSQLPAVKAWGGEPAALVQAIRPLWARAERAPDQARYGGEPPDVLLKAWSDWQAQRERLEAPARSAWTADAIARVGEMAANKTLSRYQANWMPGWLEKMAAWAQGADVDLKLIERFASSTLQDKGWAAADQFEVYRLIDALAAHLREEPAIADDLLAHAADAIGEAYAQAKARLAQFDFSDLLQRLYLALQAPDGRLARAIRQQFPVALVDEFQDTDPWQYGALSRIYADPHGTDATGLVMIGDPKQAIYSFRGADLATYLKAREQAQGIHTLSGNYRSTAGVVAAVNHLFSRADGPFGDIPFEPVSACNDKVQPLRVDDRELPGLTVWWQQAAEPLSGARLRAAMSELFASQMVALLNGEAAQPGEMAVLVRSGIEAQAMQAALARRGVRSVYLSDRDSVYASPEAQDLWRVLRAVAFPRSSAWIKAALATSLWGLDWPALDALLHDEAAWDGVIDRFHAWQQVWERQGLLPMLHRLLHDEGIPARLLAGEGQGERRLTNVLHLGDLLQSASLGLQGAGSVIRYLELQMQDPQASGDAAQTRLESDAALVQIVTMHKSKGLQYPLVFLPFASGFRASDEDDEQRLAEDMRLLYVALTRAERAMWLGVAPVHGDLDGKTPKLKSALSRLLGRRTPDDLPKALQGWQGCAAIAVGPAPQADGVSFTDRRTPQARKPALQSDRTAFERWWTASFSALTRELHEGHDDVRGSERDERLVDAQIDSRDLSGDALPAAQPDLLASPWNAFPAGSAYGSLLHDLLEWQAQQGWPAARPSSDADPAWTQLLARKRTALQLDEAQAGMLDAWVSRLCRAELTWPQADQGLALGRLRRGQAWAEMGFSLPVRRLGAERLDQLMQHYLQPGQPREALQPRQLEGMLTGFMDLVFEHQGRYYVLDYKSNRLPAYDARHLRQVVLAHRYEVQYGLYLLALHRLLKSRLTDYSPERHLGGALYWFVRGVDEPGQGLYVDRPDVALIAALDTLFAGASS